MIVWANLTFRNAIWLRIRNTDYNIEHACVYCGCQDHVCICLSELQYIFLLMELTWLYTNGYIGQVMLYPVPKGRSERRENVSEI